MPDEAQDQSFVDRMAQDDDPLASLRGDESEAAATDEGKGADGGAPPSAPASDPAIAEIKGELGKLRDEVFAKGQEIAYLRGERSRPAEAPAAKEEAPKPFEFNKEVFAAELDKDPATAIYSLIDKMHKSGIDLARRDIEQGVDGKLNQTQKQEQLRSAYDRDAQRTTKEFGEFVGVDAQGKPVNPEFDGAAWQVAQDLARDRGNPKGPNGNYLLSPGDMYTAAALTHGRWMREGKIGTVPKAAVPAAPRSLRAIIDQVPRSDNLGSNGAARGSQASSKPTMLQDLLGTSEYPTQKHIDAAKNVCKRNGWDEKRFVVNVLEAQRNGEFDN